MTAPVQALFEPFRLGSLELPTRVVMAPMTRSFSPGGVPNAKVVEYYRRRAAAGVGPGARYQQLAAVFAQVYYLPPRRDVRDTRHPRPAPPRRQPASRRGRTTRSSHAREDGRLCAEFVRGVYLCASFFRHRHDPTLDYQALPRPRPI